MSFGKRNAPPAASSMPQSQPRPAPAIFDELPEEAAPSAIIPPANNSAKPLTAYEMKERLDEGRLRFEARSEDMTRRARERYARAEIRPFCLIPASYWNGKGGELLASHLALFPFDDWNVAFLAADEASAAMLDLPVHPGTAGPAANETVGKMLAEADLQLGTAFNAAQRSDDFSAYALEREELQARVRKLAVMFLAELDSEWQKSKLEAAN
jgi:hypothetical protein